jgi:hypothetical protein
MYVNLEIEYFNFDTCKGKLGLKIHVETVIDLLEFPG